MTFVADCNAQPNWQRPHPRRQQHRVKQKSIAAFSAKKMDIDGTTQKYRVATISGKSSSDPALEVYLHGSSARGDDNTSQMGNSGVTSIYNYLTSHSMNAVILVPQCPKDCAWSETDGRSSYNKKHQYNGYVKKLMDQYVIAMHIDKSRIYVLGASMGVFGVYGMIRDYPDYFTAALCASGGVLRSGEKNKLVKTPVYLTVGTKEGQSNAALYQKLADELNANGGNDKCDVLEALEHRQACSQAFSNERMKSEQYLNWHEKLKIVHSLIALNLYLNVFVTLLYLIVFDAVKIRQFCQFLFFSKVTSAFLRSFMCKLFAPTFQKSQISF